MKIAVYSITNTLFEGEAERIIAQTPEGQITVLDSHVPLITRLTGPVVEIADREGRTTAVPLSNGILDVRPESEVVILAESV
ncbi:MAG: hypothetical protein HY472_00870 [Candidatus Sungbacteria bacterium]|nr:hypothetical protein [Candidatus Sungbacteria bacterium]